MTATNFGVTGLVPWKTIKTVLPFNSAVSERFDSLHDIKTDRP